MEKIHELKEKAAKQQDLKKSNKLAELRRKLKNMVIIKFTQKENKIIPKKKTINKKNKYIIR